MITIETPIYGLTRFVCPHCGTLAQQTWSRFMMDDESGLWEPARDGAVEDDQLVLDQFEVPDGWNMSMCFACKRGSVWRGHRIVFPVDSDLPRAHPMMPAGVVALYDEARAIGAVSARGGAAFARVALEAVLTEVRPGVDGRLDDRIAEVHPAVSSTLWQMLTVVRATGNDVLHAGDESAIVVRLTGDDGATLSLLLTAINDLVDELIARPKQAALLFAKLPPGVVADAQRKAKAATAKRPGSQIAGYEDGPQGKSV